MSAAPVQAHARSCSRTTTKPCTTGFSCRGGAELSTSGRTPVHFIVHKCSRRRVAQNALRSSIGLTVRTDTAFVQARSTAALPTFRNCVVQNSWCIRCLCFGRLPSPWAIKNLLPSAIFCWETQFKLIRLKVSKNLTQDYWPNPLLIFDGSAAADPLNLESKTLDSMRFLRRLAA